MDKKNWKFTYEYLNRYGRQVVKALKERAPVETGSLRADINFEIIDDSSGFNILFYIDDHIKPINSKTPPSEYANILDQSNKTHYRSTSRVGQKTEGWFSDDIPGLEQNVFTRNLETAMARDIEKQIQNNLRR